MKKLNGSDKVTVYAAVEDDFFVYDSFLGLYYRQFSKKVKQNHILGCSKDNWDKNKLNVELCKSSLSEDKIALHNAIKTGFFGRNNYPKKAKGLEEAIANLRRT